MDFFKIGALKVFSDLGELIKADEMINKKISFLDLPEDCLKIIRTYLKTFDNKEQKFNFLIKFSENKNKDIYKFFYQREQNFYQCDFNYFDLLAPKITKTIKHFKYKFILLNKNEYLDKLLIYVNTKYKKIYQDYSLVCDIDHFDNLTKFIEIGRGNIIINSKNKLQFDNGTYKGFSKEYNLPKEIETYLNKNIWNFETKELFY